MRRFRSSHLRHARLGRVLTTLILLSAGAPVSARGEASKLPLKLDPSLASWAYGAPGEAGSTEARTIWVGFAGKSPRGPAELAEGLARAEYQLTPRARARRRRARVEPLVDERDLPVAADYVEQLERLGHRPFAGSRWLNRVAVRVAPAGLEPLARLPFVASLSPVPTMRTTVHPAGTPVTIERARAPRGPSALGTPSGPGIAAGQLEQIGVTALHSAGYTGNGRLIAIFDQGFNFTWKHDALRDIVFPPGYLRDFVEGDTVVSDTTDLFNLRHGTWVLGLLGADLPGIYQGSAPGATFALARTEVGASETPVEMLYWAQAAEWADSLGADMIASSVGYNFFDSPFPSFGPGDLDGQTTEISRAAQIAASKGILLVNSVGNGGFGPLPRLAAPADVNGDSLLAVGAVDTLGNVASFSSRGPTFDGRIKPDLVARGVQAWLVHGTGQPSAYERQDGTSFAAPLVAGLAACLMEARPALAPVDVIRALRETASAMCVPDQNRGWGIPNGPAALSWVPGPSGVSRAPLGHLELVNTGANPMRRATGPLRLRFGLGPRFAGSTEARLRVFDAQGRLVRGLFYGSLTCGHWQAVDWDGHDRDGRRVQPGVYLVHFDARGRTSTLRVALLE